MVWHLPLDFLVLPVLKNRSRTVKGNEQKTSEVSLQVFPKKAIRDMC